MFPPVAKTPRTWRSGAQKKPALPRSALCQFVGHFFSDGCLTAPLQTRFGICRSKSSRGWEDKASGIRPRNAGFYISLHSHYIMILLSGQRL
jgi:hypothetical protein